MRHLFDIESPLMTWLSRLADLMVLNLLWLLSCVPIITVGAATAALYSASIRHHGRTLRQRGGRFLERISGRLSTGDGVVGDFVAAAGDHRLQYLPDSMISPAISGLGQAAGADSSCGCSADFRICISASSQI